MALSPSIPTSFVPKQPVTPAGNKRYSSSGTSVFLIIATVIFVLAIAVAIGTFAYDKYLQNESNVEAKLVLAKEEKTATTTLSDLILLQNRLTAAQTVINQHIALTQFFNLLGNITAKDVTFSSVSIAVAEDRTATLSLHGIAKNFNALENESLLFDQQTQYIKNPIFSDFVLNKDNTVTFSVSGTLTAPLVKENAIPQEYDTSLFVPTSVPSSVPASMAVPASTTAAAGTSLSTTTP